MKEIIRIGVFGGRRGESMISWCHKHSGVRVVAICDKAHEVIESLKKKYSEESIFWCSDFEEFLKCDMDAVVLANYATEHAPYAVRCLDRGLNVMSEVLPCQNMKEAVELVEAVERSGKIYFYAENYCYFPATTEMRRLYREGKLGKLEYGEGEYVHNCEPIWHELTYGDPNHWRNNINAFFYCTHSLGPLIHITGERPVSVTGFELPFTDRMARIGAKKGVGGIEMVTLESGAVLRSLHGQLSKDSIWYSIYGSKGRIESVRPDAVYDMYNVREGYPDGTQKVYIALDEKEGDNHYDPRLVEVNLPGSEKDSHGGSDNRVLVNFVKALRNEPDAEIIDVYEAMDMFLPGMFAYFSVLEGGKPMNVPDLSDISERNKWRNDTRCCDRKAAGDMYIPSYSRGEIEIPDVVYETVRKKYNDSIKEKKQ